jgi:hypothetical protein
MVQWGVAFLTKRRQVRIFPGHERAVEGAVEIKEKKGVGRG